MAADLQFSTILNEETAVGGIVIEVAYSQKSEDARNKAKRYLIEADSPRPSVLVIFNLEEKGSREEYRNVELFSKFGGVILEPPRRPSSTKEA